MILSKINYIIDIRATNISCLNIMAIDIDALNITARNINCINLTAKDIIALNIDARGEIDCYDTCVASEYIKCKSIIGGRNDD